MKGWGGGGNGKGWSGLNLNGVTLCKELGWRGYYRASVLGKIITFLHLFIKEYIFYYFMGNLCDTGWWKDVIEWWDIWMGGVCILYYTICITLIYKGRLKDVIKKGKTLLNKWYKTDNNNINLIGLNSNLSR